LQGGFGQGGRSQGRSIPPPAASPDPSPPLPPAAPQTDIPQATQDSQAMNEILRQLFNK
jgi:hypothetical protein